MRSSIESDGRIIEGTNSANVQHKMWMASVRLSICCFSTFKIEAVLMVSKSFCKYKVFLLDLPFRKCKKNALFLPNPIDRHPFFIDQPPISGKRLGSVERSGGSETQWHRQKRSRCHDFFIGAWALPALIFNGSGGITD